MENAELIKQILNRIDRLEKAVFADDKKKPKKIATSSGTKLPSQILDLRENEYFKQPRTTREVHEKLQPNYPCERNRVKMALIRLLKKRMLRKTSKIVNKEKSTAYVW